MCRLMLHTGTKFSFGSSGPGRASSETLRVYSSLPQMAPVVGERSACSCGRRASSGVCSSLQRRKRQKIRMRNCNSKICNNFPKSSIWLSMEMCSNVFVEKISIFWRNNNKCVFLMILQVKLNSCSSSVSKSAICQNTKCWEGVDWIQALLAASLYYKNSYVAVICTTWFSNALLN